MNRRAFIGSVSVASAGALGHRPLLAEVPTRFDQIRARLGIEGPILLRGFFYQGYCPIALDGSTIVRSPLGESVSVGCVGRKAMAHDLLQAISLDRFPHPDEARKRYGLTFARPASPDRFSLILGRDNAWSFRELLAKWFDDVRLELPAA